MEVKATKGLVRVTVPASAPYASRAVERAGLRIVQVDGLWYGDEGAQAIIDAHDSRQEAIAERRHDLEAEAERRVGAQTPLWLQSDLTLRLVRLLCIRAGVGTGSAGRALTAEEQAEASENVARIKRLQDIRQARRQIEARIESLPDVWAVIAEDIARAAEWPAG